MKVKQYFKSWAWALALPVVLFSACDDDENPGGGGSDDDAFRAEQGVYVFNNGNEGYSINGSLTFIDPAGAAYKNDVFTLVNGRELGSTVQDGVVLGDQLYIAVFGSNTVEVVDKHTVESIAQILPTTAQGKGPRDIVTDGEYVYVSMQDGYVSRINPATYTIDNTVKVGPNPEEMAVVGDYLYVANSDGLNYESGYVNGKSVSKVRLSDFTEEEKIAVGMNPTKLVAHTASGKLFVGCMGDYMDNPTSLWVIDTATGTATDLAVPVTLMCLSGNTLYTIYNQYGSPEDNRYISYNATDNSVLDEAFIPVVESVNGFTSNVVDNPAGIVVNPADGHIFIASYVDDPANAYSLPSYVYEYDAEGYVQRRYDVGVGAVNMLILD